MDTDEIANVLNTFAQWPRSFKLEELLDFVELPINQQTLESALLSDSRFICLDSEPMDERHFISKTTLFRWFSNLNLRLAQIRKFRLNEHQLALAMSCLRRNGRWHIPPTQAMQFGKRLGLVGSAWIPDQYVFPLARLLSFSLMSVDRSILQDILQDFAEMARLSIPFGRLQQESLQVLQEALQEVLSRCSNRELYVVKAREGLLTGTEMTLEQISCHLGMTKERVRQLEKKFWQQVLGLKQRPDNPFMRRWLLKWMLSKSCRKPQEHVTQGRLVRALLTALLCDVMSKQGSLIYNTDSPEAPLKRLIATCLYIPQLELSHLGPVILAAQEAYLLKGFITLKSCERLPEGIEIDAIANRLNSELGLCLTDADLRVLAERVAHYRLRCLKKSPRVYLALRAIGRPAHYSEITEVYNALFPDRPATEHNIHSFLSREEHGVVWIGVRGTFALKEWGYERPSKSLYEAVAEVVQKRWKETGKPVPFTVITAEIARYRKVVKPSSLIFATHCNPRLRRVSNDSFIPKDHVDKTQDEVSADELDKILQEFQKRSGV